MKRLSITVTTCLFLLLSNLYGQDNLKRTQYLSLGSRHNGICLGNSINYNGIRLNLWDGGFDKDSAYRNINGINSSLWVYNKQMNGIDLGVIGTISYKMNGVQIGGLISSAEYLNGFALGGIGVRAQKINGVGLGGFMVTADTLNGVFTGLLAVGNSNNLVKVINGVAFAFISVSAEKIRGVTLAVFGSGSKEHYGLAIGGANFTDNLHGLQIGLINHAGNNPKLLRWLPFINFHK